MLFILFGINGDAQLLNNKESDIFKWGPLFNHDFVRKNKIKSINCKVLTKKINDIIRKPQRGQSFYFTPEGHLKTAVSQYQIGTYNMDTTAVMYNYDDEGQVIIQRTHNDNFFYLRYFERDPNGRIIKTIHLQDHNEKIWYTDLSNKESLFNTETLVHTKLNNREWLTKVYNNEGKVYKEIKTSFDAWDHKNAEVEVFTFNNQQTKTTYEYNMRRQLIKKNVVTNIKSKKNQTFIFEFNGDGNIVKEDYYEEGKHTFIKEYLYNDKNLLKASIQKDIHNEFMTIIKYHYGYYQELSSGGD